MISWWGNKKLIGNEVRFVDGFGYTRVGKFEQEFLWRDMVGVLYWIEEEGLWFWKGCVEINMGFGKVVVDVKEDVDIEKELLKVWRMRKVIGR